MQFKIFSVLIMLFFFKSVTACQQKKYYSVPVYKGVSALQYTNPYYRQAAELLCNSQTTDTFYFPDKTRRVISLAAAEVILR